MKKMQIFILFFILISDTVEANEFIIHTISDAVQYEKGKVHFIVDGNNSTVHPVPSSEPSKEFAINYSEKLQPLTFAPDEKLETILKRIQHDQDGRIQITKTIEWPYRFHAQLGIYFSDGTSGGGSGVMVGPHHLLTCGHNIFDQNHGGWVKKVAVRVALHNDTIPFEEAFVTKIYTYKKWIDSSDYNHDIALLVLNHSVGHYTGWGGLLSTDSKVLSKEIIHITGYPGDKGCKQMWTMSHTPKYIGPERIYYDIDTFPGQSGSGIWINSRGSPYVIGIHTRGESVLDQGNSGVHLTSAKFNDIVKEWITSTYRIKQNPNQANVSMLGAAAVLPSTPQKPKKKRNREDSDTEDGITTLFSGKKEKVDPATLDLKELAEKNIGFKDERIKNETTFAKKFLKDIITLGVTKQFITSKLKITSSVLDGFIGDKETKNPEKIVIALKKVLSQPTSEFVKDVRKSYRPVALLRK